MNKLLIIVFVLSLSMSSVFAQTPLRPRDPNETFLERTAAHLNNNDHRWTQWHTSRRFQLLYSDTEAPISQANANAALNELEEIFDVFVYDNGFQHPYHNRAENLRYKMCVYVLRPGEGHAFGGVTGTNNSTVGNTSGPGMWLSAGAVNDKWALAHEFMHGLQAMAGGMGGGETNNATNFRGWFYESHANLMPHVVYPNEVHYCAEMYTRMPQAYLGSTRNRYCNWQFFEYVIHQKGVAAINDLWLSPPTSSTGAGTRQNPHNHDPFTELMARNGMSQNEFNDFFGEFAMRMVIHDINHNSTHFNPTYRGRGSAQFRNAYNGVAAHFRRSRYTYLEELDLANNRYVVPFAAAPQRYAYNIIRLYPDANNSTVTVRFRGDVQTQNNIPNYTRSLNLEPIAANLPNNPRSNWRYGLVAVTGDATSRTGTVTARHSELMRTAYSGSANDNHTPPDVTIQMRSGETQLYLVVAATPDIHHRISWDQFYYTIYRFPYMVQIDGAKPEGFQHVNDRPHSNGGGYVASGATVAATAYVGPNARVTGGRVEGNARIEGHAIVAGGTVRGNAVVKDHAFVNAGTIEGNAVIHEGANIWGGTFSENAQVGGIANVRITGTGAGVRGYAKIMGAPWIDGQTLNLSGNAVLYGDGEVYGVTASSGCHTGLVDAGTIANNQHNRCLSSSNTGSEPPREVTAPRSMRWPDGSTNVAMPSTVKNNTPRFSVDNRGILKYDLAGARSATLKVFDTRGRVLRTMTLSGTKTSARINVNAAPQILFWKIDVDGKSIGTGKFAP